MYTYRTIDLYLNVAFINNRKTIFFRYEVAMAG